MMVVAITRGPANPISAPGSASKMSHADAKLAVTPPVVGWVIMQRLDEAVTLHRQTGQRQLEGHALAAWGDVYFERGQAEQAVHYYGESLKLRWALDDRKGEGWMLHHLARVYALEGETDRAHDSAAQATKIAEEIGDEELLKACRCLLKA